MSVSVRDLRAKRDRLLPVRATHYEEIPAKPPTGEVGSPGTAVAPGVRSGSYALVEQDYNPDLRGQNFFNEINRMRLSDSQVKAVMAMVKLPLLAADWNVEGASDSAEDVEIAEWLEDRFFNHMTKPWHYTLRHMLLSLDFGSMPMETVFEIRDDEDLKRPMVYLEKLAPRFPNTITEWNVDDTGELIDIKQVVDRKGQPTDLTITADRLLCFTHEMEGANWKGTSILRQARKDWVIKERLQRINQVAIEKRASGVDVGSMDEMASQEEKNREAFETSLMSIRTHERNFLLLPQGHDYKIAGIEGQVLDPLPSIKYADVMILRSILADFLTAGTGDTGSFAMVKDRSSFYLMSLLGVSKEIVEPWNRYLIPKLVRWNWPDIKEMPHLVHSRLDRRDVTALATALGTLIDKGVITPDSPMEKELRDLLDLPRLDPNAEPMPRPGEDGLPGMSDLLNPKTGPEAYRRYRARQRVRPVYEVRTKRRLKVNARRVVDWVVMASSIDETELKIVRAYKSLEKKQIDKVVDEAMKAIDKLDATGLEEVNVPFIKEVADAIVQPLIDLYRVGQSSVKQEMARMGGNVIKMAQPMDPASDIATMAFLRARARMIARSLAERLRGSVMRNGMDLIRDTARGRTFDTTPRLVLVGKLEDLSDRLIRGEAKLSVSEALNLGRDSVAKANASIVKMAEYSAIMDEGTCTACESQDGKDFEYGSEEFEHANPPYVECEGRSRCRCVMIYTFETEGN